MRLPRPRVKGRSSPFGQLRLAVGLGLGLMVIGTAGYVGIEHYGLLDALFMTVITLSSVGYGTIRPLDTAGEVFTIALILFGFGAAAWAFTTVVQVFVSEETRAIFARRRMDRVVDALNHHYIICGFGRIGQEIASGYTQNKVPFVVIEREPERVAMLRERQIPHIVGDAADDDALLAAGLRRASALIAVTPTDAINTFIVLSARGLCPDVRIVVRADSPQNEAKLRRAGADKVISPHVLGGRWMGIAAINPAVTDFVTAMTEADHAQFLLREFVMDALSALSGQTLGNAHLHDRTGALVVAIRQGQGDTPGRFLPNPPDAYRLRPQDVLIAIGSPQELTALAALVNPGHPQTIILSGMEA